MQNSASKRALMMAGWAAEFKEILGLRGKCSHEPAHISCCAM